MEPEITYQQDTVVVKSLPKTLPANHSIAIERQPVSVIKDSQRSTETPAPPRYTPQQIRYWRTQQESKLLVDSAKFIRPRSELNLSFTAQPSQDMILPIREKVSRSTDWITILLFTALLLFASIRYSYLKYIKQLFTSLVSYPTSVRLMQESSYPPSHVATRLDIIFYLVSSVFIYQALHIFSPPEINNQFIFFAIVLSGVVLYFLGKKFLYSILGLMFETRTETGEYLFNLNNSNRLLGLALLPVVVLLFYSPIQAPTTMVAAGLILFLAFQAMLLRRGILILLRKQFSIFYLFLYLCTLEFLPLLLIYKIVVVE